MDKRMNRPFDRTTERPIGNGDENYMIRGRCKIVNKPIDCSSHMSPINVLMNLIDAHFKHIHYSQFLNRTYNQKEREREMYWMKERRTILSIERPRKEITWKPFNNSESSTTILSNEIISTELY